MKFKDIFKVKVSVPVFVVILFLCSFLGLTFVNKVSAEHWDGCSCPHTGAAPQTWIFKGAMNCSIGIVWCANCEYDIAGYEMEYKIVTSQPTGIIGPDDSNNPWPGVGIQEGDSPIKIWLPGMRPEGETGGIILADKDRPKIRLNGLTPGKYYVLALRAVNTKGFKSVHSDENSGYTVCGPGAITDLIIF